MLTVICRLIIFKLILLLSCNGESIFDLEEYPGIEVFRRRRSHEEDLNQLITQHPYTVSIALSSKHWCSGAILSPSWVLSAAQCFDYVKMDNLLVRAGTPYSTSGGQVSSVIAIKRHPYYRMDLFYPEHSLAMLKLATPFMFNSMTRHVNLPPEKAELSVKDEDLIVTGFGNNILETNTVSMQERLAKGPIRRFKVRTTQTSKCRILYSQEYYLQYDNFCLLSDGDNLCTGDTGDPAVSFSEVEPLGVIYGVAIYAGSQKPCFKRTNPGIYVKVSYSRNWIDSLIKESSDLDKDINQEKVQIEETETPKDVNYDTDDLVDEPEDDQREVIDNNQLEYEDEKTTVKEVKTTKAPKILKYKMGDQLQLVELPRPTNRTIINSTKKAEDIDYYDHTIDNDQSDDSDVEDNAGTDSIEKKMANVKQQIDDILYNTTQFVTEEPDEQYTTTDKSYEYDYQEDDEEIK